MEKLMKEFAQTGMNQSAVIPPIRPLKRKDKRARGYYWVVKVHV
jgi:hypothetical protein